MHAAAAAKLRQPELEFVADLAKIGSEGPELPIESVRSAMGLTIGMFRSAALRNDYPPRGTTALTTKFRDAGRRSAPWRPASSKVPGRPQDGADGNRINRWLMEPDHKFYATEKDATLVEIRYFFQALSMADAPDVEGIEKLKTWEWLSEGPIGTGEYLDPVQLVPINFNDFFDNPRLVTSGHFVPLDRGGRHLPHNTFLTLKISNDLQGNHTVDELLDILNQILEAHRRLRGWQPSRQK
jgi:hypothetical protein